MAKNSQFPSVGQIYDSIAAAINGAGTGIKAEVRVKKSKSGLLFGDYYLLILNGEEFEYLKVKPEHSRLSSWRTEKTGRYSVQVRHPGIRGTAVIRPRKDGSHDYQRVESLISAGWSFLKARKARDQLRNQRDRNVVQPLESWLSGYEVKGPNGSISVQALSHEEYQVSFNLQVWLEDGIDVRVLVRALAEAGVLRRLSDKKKVRP